MPKEDVFLVEIGEQLEKKSDFLFMRTPTYTLGSNHCITVLPGHTANIYTKFAAVTRQGQCVRKKITRITSKDYVDRDYYVLFISSHKLPATTWGVGKLPVKSGVFEYQVGANGDLEAVITDHDAYIDHVCGDGNEGVFDVGRVTEHLFSVVQNAAAEILIELFEEIGTMIINANFLMDELNLRLRQYFIEDGRFSIPGIRITLLNANSLLIKEDDIQKARDALAPPPTEPQSIQTKRGSSVTRATKRSPAARSGRTAKTPSGKKL